MQHAIVALRSIATTPTPTPTPAVDPNLVTPGVVGFLFTALIAIAVIFLVWDMMRRIRRGRVRADIQEQLDAEEQAARATEATEVDDESIDPASDEEPGDAATPPKA